MNRAELMFQLGGKTSRVRAARKLAREPDELSILISNNNTVVHGGPTEPSKETLVDLTRTLFPIAPETPLALLVAAVPPLQPHTHYSLALLFSYLCRWLQHFFLPLLLCLRCSH